MTEAMLMEQIRLALNDPDGVWFRNNVGVATLAGGGRLRYGVGNPGGADLIGLFRGRFAAIEIKTPEGRQSQEQRMFQQLVERKGGIYVICRSADDARALLARLRGMVAP
jgi:ribosomal protein L36